MKRTNLWPALLVVCMLGCGQKPQQSAQSTVVDEPTDTTEILSIAEPIRHENLSVFPVISKSAQTTDPFITLDEGLKSGTIEIREGSSADGGGNDPFGGDPFAQSPAEGNADPFGSSNPFDDTDPFADASGSAPADPFANASDDPSDPFAISTDPFAQGDEEEANDQAEIESPYEQQPATEENSIDDLFGSIENHNDDQQQSAEPVFPVGERFSAEEMQAMLGAVDDIFGGGGDISGQSVNQLFVLNRSDKPLYLMPGELILGGDQDRMIAEETIIPPNGQPTAIDVYCVEQGRWGSRDTSRTIAELQTFAMAEQSAPITYPTNLSLVVASTAEVNEGKFVASVGSVTNAVRKAAQIDKQQSSVWHEVAEANSMGTVEAPTDAFTANYVQPANLERLEPYLSELSETVPDNDNVVGVIVAINGELVSMDVFNSTPLFKKLWPKMLKGFALQAANQAGDEEIQPCEIEDARQFLVDSIGASVTTTSDHGQIAVDRRESEDVICLSGRLTEESGAAFGGGMMGGGMGDSPFGAVHSTSFPK